MRTADRLIAPPRSTLAQAKAYAARFRFPDGDEDVLDYLAEVYRLAPLVGLDPSIVVAQSVHETADPQTGAPWASRWWRERRNPAGIGITGDPAQNEASKTWANGADAARGHIAHLMAYTYGINETNRRWPAPFFPHTYDPRYGAYVDAYGYGAIASTIADLAGKWAVDPQYAEKIAAKGNAIFADLPDQEEPAVTMPTIPVHWTPVPVGAPNNPQGLLLPGDLILVWHENGNPNSDAGDESRFLLNGGGEGRVSYHFAVDHERAFQMFALNELCWHAADGCDNPATDRGCFRGVAIEHCQDRDPVRWAATKRNGAILTAMIIAGHPSIHFGGRAGNFSADRIETHQAVSDTKKHCPDWMLNEGAIPGQIARVKAFLAMDGTTTTTTTAPPEKPLRLPKGTSSGEVRARFNPRGLRNPRNGQVARFNLNGEVSRAYLRHVLASNPAGKVDTDFRWPALVSITRLGNGKISWQFSDGYVYEQG